MRLHRKHTAHIPYTHRHMCGTLPESYCFRSANVEHSICTLMRSTSHVVCVCVCGYYGECKMSGKKQQHELLKWNNHIDEKQPQHEIFYRMCARERDREGWKRIRVLFFRFGILVIMWTLGFPHTLFCLLLSVLHTHIHWLFLYALAQKGLFPNANIISSNHSNIYEYQHIESSSASSTFCPLCAIIYFSFLFYADFVFPFSFYSHALPYRNDMHFKLTLAGWPAGWIAFDQIFRHACTIISSTEHRINSIRHDVYKRVSVYMLEFTSPSSFSVLVNKHKYFPISVDIGGNKPSALMPPLFLYVPLIAYARICVHTHIQIAFAYVFIFPKKILNTERIREPAVDLLHSTCHIKNSKKKNVRVLGYVLYVVCSVSNR